MEVRLQFVAMFACIVYFGSTFVQPYNQMIDQEEVTRSYVNDEDGIQDNLEKLLNSIAKNDERNSKTYHEILKQESRRVRQDFNAMKEELLRAKSKRNSRDNNGGNFLVVKREAITNKPSSRATTSRITKPPVVMDDASSSEEKRFPIPITPITTINNTKVMKFVEDLWVSQRKLYNEIVHKTEVLVNKTNFKIRHIRYLFNEIDPLFRRQIRVLTKHPWEDTDEMYEALDYELLGQQIRSYNALGRCLTDHYHFAEELKAEERDLRKSIIDAKNKLVKRRTTLVGMTNINFTMFKDPYSVESYITE